ncbi:cryptochrome/photolyase family protein [Pelagicoccus albus]|uniref:Deoxyribodipyrimidine photo-lyase n=1 Tax=Pelagicoccus albus TaxID=415222 RepID=A0A7X1E6F7_9BACT|nr:deoxyribodipyrimidine photo-lyase [Pelagicoccus albus]MBC2604640.1 deoxyribodipyrimidine photo-lyase [Pelagicoccus albus]
MPEQNTVIVWFRQDLRLSDNPALHEAVESGGAILPLYILDDEGEGDWPLGGASRWWLHHSLVSLDSDLRKIGSKLTLLRGGSSETLAKLCEAVGAKSVFWNRRYEPEIIARDTKIKKSLADKGLEVRSFNGSLLQSPLKVEKKSGGPFKVFTPFWNHLKTLKMREPLPAPGKLSAPKDWPDSDELDSWELLPKLDWAGGFSDYWTPGENAATDSLDEFLNDRVKSYDENRDNPAIVGVSRMSPHLHFGEISPIQIWHKVDRRTGDAYARQIAWREFAFHLLYHFPETSEKALRPEFDRFPWKENQDWLKAWQQGRTGYPIVDAGMRELWSTGWMHNRVRMIAASFLVKHLLQPWHSGAEWFWDTLVDADLPNNSMGWQWVAGSGADASPYFRIFNPITQGERFDAKGEYTRKWVPELARLPDKYLFKPWEAPANVLEYAGVDLGGNYPQPIVSHAEGRAAALEAYAKLKDG